MTTTIREENGKFIAVFEGRLDTPSSLQTQVDIKPLLDNADKEIVLDCKDPDIKKVFEMTGFYKLFEIRD